MKQIYYNFEEPQYAGRELGLRKGLQAGGVKTSEGFRVVPYLLSSAASQFSLPVFWLPHTSRIQSLADLKKGGILCLSRSTLQLSPFALCPRMLSFTNSAQLPCLASGWDQLMGAGRGGCGPGQRLEGGR